MSYNQKPKKPSLIDFTKKYANNEQACYDFFFNAKYPNGYYCEKCGCTHYHKITRHRVVQCKECGHQQYLFANTIFQDNKLDLYKLLLGLFLFFNNSKGISAMDMKSHLDVNYKTALLLCRKCRILMAESNSDKILDSMFYEADTAYIGVSSKGEHMQGMATEKQPFLAVLSTLQENRYPQYLKLFPIPKDAKDMMEKFLSKSIVTGPERILNTDGKSTFSSMSDKVTLQSDKVSYEDEEHKLYWLNIIIGDVKSQITGIYHGVSKRDMPLFLQEQAYRFNHRFTGKDMASKIKKYLLQSTPMPRKSIIRALDTAEPYFTPTCV